MIYQLMFAIITPALISGAFAERMKFSAMLLFTCLWSTIVYFPMAHMVWGKGGLLNAFLGGPIPCFDFAGGTVVHITSGVSALICALYIGKRVGYPKEPMKPHSLVEWLKHGKPSMLGGISGAVAGLVAITPASGFVKPFPALFIGFAAGIFCFYMVSAVKNKFGYDDTLDAFGVHGAGGTLGALLTGVFATREINDGLKDAAGKALPLGLVDGHAGQILNQAIGVAISWVLAIAGTLIILKIVDAVIGVRASTDEEVEGLDLSMHGEEGYNLEG
jgi:Amt family ammonium transporter